MSMSSEEEEYNAFLEKVRRTIYVDNLAPQVTESVIKAAFNQFGGVQSVQFIPSYFESKNMSPAVLVEMGTPKNAKEIVAQMGSFPFMISGMPRPVRAQSSRAEMFDDHPRKPGRRIQCYWMDPKDPEFEVAKKIEQTVARHVAEVSLLLEQQRAEEEKLANQQSETLRSNYKKYEILDRVIEDGTARRLGRHYNISIADS